MIIFAVLFGDGSDTKFTHVTFNLDTLIVISNSKTANFQPNQLKKILYVEFKLILYKYFFNHCNRQPIQHPIRLVVLGFSASGLQRALLF